MDPNESNYNMMFPGGTGGYGGGFGGGNQVGAAQGGSDNGSNSGFNWSDAASGLGGIASGLFGMFGGQQNPSSAAAPYLNKISGANQQYLGPYNQMGQQEGQNLQGQYNQLTSNPGAMFNKIGQSYHQSPGFQFALHQAMMGANNSAAAGGMAGSPQNTQQNMQLATNMGNQDYYNYMQNAMGLYGQGLHGEQGMYGVGAEAGNNMAGNISEALSQQAQNAYNGQAGQNQAQGNSFSNLIGGAADIASMFGG